MLGNFLTRMAESASEWIPIGVIRRVGLTPIGAHDCRFCDMDCVSARIFGSDAVSMTDARYEHQRST